ncbi:MAG: hypothetical protein ABSE46_18030 [Terracidiphilus sp.]|jgi:hypothetical protein
MKWAWLFAAVPALVLTASGQVATTGAPVIQVDFSNPDLSPSHWTLIIHPDGSGHFQSERNVAPATRSQGIEAPNVDRDVQVSAEFAGRVFQMAQSHRLFQMECESHMKVAFQGWKKLSYRGPGGEGSCEFNFSRDKEIEALGESLVAVAETIVEGARLETLLQHDPLGLDHETEYLVEAAGDGRVQQICAIRGILERLASDDAVMERVRKRARMLLARAEG